MARVDPAVPGSAWVTQFAPDPRTSLPKSFDLVTRTFGGLAGKTGGCRRRGAVVPETLKTTRRSKFLHWRQPGPAVEKPRRRAQRRPSAGRDRERHGGGSVIHENFSIFAKTLTKSERWTVRVPDVSRAAGEIIVPEQMVANSIARLMVAGTIQRGKLFFGSGATIASRPPSLREF